MRLVEIRPDIVYSIVYEGEEKDAFSQLMEQWLDVEYLDKYFLKHKDYIENNSFFEGIPFEEIVASAKIEAMSFLTDFMEFYENSLNGEHPDLCDKFKNFDNFVYNQRPIIRSKMYGESRTKINSLFRLYALKVNNPNTDEPPFFIITGGGIKIKKDISKDRFLSAEKNKLISVQRWLEQNGIKSIEQLITSTK